LDNAKQSIRENRSRSVILLFFISLSLGQFSEKITIATIEASDSPEDFRLLYEMFELEKSNIADFNRLVYRMYGDSPQAGDEIIFFPSNDNYAPIIKNITDKTILGREEIIMSYILALTDDDLKRIIDDYGITYYYSIPEEPLEPDTLTLFYNEVQKSLYAWKVNDNKFDQYKKNDWNVNLRLNISEIRIDSLGEETTVYVPKSFYQSDTLYFVGDNLYLGDIEVEELERIMQTDSIFLGNYQRQIFRDKFTYTDLDKGVQRAIPLFTSNERQIGDFIAGSQDSLGIKTVLNPETGRPIGKVIGTIKELEEQDYIYGSPTEIKKKEIEDESGGIHTIYQSEDDQVDIEIKKKGKGNSTGKISKFLIAGMSMFLLYFFTA